MGVRSCAGRKIAGSRIETGAGRGARTRRQTVGVRAARGEREGFGQEVWDLGEGCRGGGGQEEDQVVEGGGGHRRSVANSLIGSLDRE